MTATARTLSDTAFERLKAMILDGTLSPGARLSEKKIADELGVSRTPVREAIGFLISEGLAVRHSGGAPVVNSVSLSDIMEILHARSLLECEAARKAAQSTSADTELAEIRGKLLKFIEGPRPDAAAHTALDMALHDRIAKMAGSKLLTEMIDSLKTKTRMFDQGSIPDRFEPGCAEHLAIIDAITARDPDSAAAAMKLHLANVRESIISHIYHPF